MGGWVGECVAAWLRGLRGCVAAWVRECVSACVRACVSE